jgi:hypothetical protein
MVRFNSTLDLLEFYNSSGWRRIRDGAVATGGTVTEYNSHRIHTFTQSGTFSVISGGNVEYLIVAGGGGGPGRDIGGGGGAGGMKTGSTQLSAGSYNIVVGVGGGGSVDGQNPITSANKGSISSFNSIECQGGGTGKVYHVTTGTFSNGGSGGGGAGYNNPNDYTPGGTGISGEGYSGGIGVVYGTNYYGGGGGGGAGEIGKSANNGRHGGDGIQSDITGTNIYYAGGGGGAGHRSAGNGSLGTGGAGGGGDAGTSLTTSDRDGIDGLGGGGGAARNTGLTGGAGGDGIVIIRYLI